MGFVAGPNLLYLSNTIGKSVVGVIHDLHDEPDILYIPMWMIHTLQVLSNLSVATAPQRICTKIVLKPMNAGLTKIPEWESKFNKSLRNYNTLTTGTTIALQIDGLQLFRVDMLYPIKYSTMYLRLQEEIELTIVSSVEEDVAEDYKPTLLRRGRPTKKQIQESAYEPIHAFYGKGQVVGGKPPEDPTLSPKMLMLQAAQARLTKNEETTRDYKRL